MGLGIQGSENFPTFSAISQSILNILVQIIYSEFSKTLHLISDGFEGSHFNKDPIFWDTLYEYSVLYPFYTYLTSKISTHHAADDQQVRHEHRLQERALRQRRGGG